VLCKGTLRELCHESSCFGKEDLQELQGRTAAARGLRDLLGCPPQTAPGLMALVQLVAGPDSGWGFGLKTLSF
jgi:hypothetical protein